MKRLLIMAALALTLTMLGCRTFLDLRFQHDRGDGHGRYERDRGDGPGRGQGPGRH
jgi:hypothetical protein